MRPAAGAVGLLDRHRQGNAVRRFGKQVAAADLVVIGGFDQKGFLPLTTRRLAVMKPCGQ